MKIDDVVTLHFLLVGVHKAEKWKVIDSKEFKGSQYLYVEPIETEKGGLCPKWIKATDFMEHPIYD